MSRNIIAIVLLVLLTVGCNSNDEGKIKVSVVSYNMRVGTAKDGENCWENRKEATLAMIEAVKPDLIGVQEALKFQADYIAGNCLEYGSYGVGREDGVEEGEIMSIFYKKDVFNLLDSFTFWLSETPAEPSYGWDAACKRTATVAFFEHRASGKRFYYVNTHLDHKGSQAQKNGLQLIVQKINEINPNGLPLILSGDFNVFSYEEPILALDKLMLNTRSVAPVTDTLGTYNGWKRKPEIIMSGDTLKPAPTKDYIIDYIFYSPMEPEMCLEYKTITETFVGIPYISDHYPIMAVLEF